MSSSANTQETLVGHFKEVYANNIKDLRPDGVELYNMAKFIENSKQGGNFYNQPITLGYEHGFSYNGTGGAVGTLEAAVAAPHANAQVIGSEIILSSYLSFAAASRSMGKNAFIQETKHIVSNMFKSFMLRLEIILMYGQSGIAIVESVSSNDITIEKEEWAAGIWAGAEGMPIEVRTSAGVKRGNTVVTAVNMATKTITVDGVPAGTVITDVLYHKGAYGNESVGLHKICSNQSASLFGVDASAYSLFQGNIVDVGTNFTGSEAVLSFAKVEEAIAKMQEKGLTKEEVVLLCNPQSWKNLLTELAAKRSFDQSYSSAKLDEGASEIVFHGPNGKIRIVSTIFCKEGYAYIICPRDFMRVGSSDVSFKQPGMDDKDMVKMLERASGYEFRAYSDQALFTASPGKTAILRYIKSA